MALAPGARIGVFEVTGSLGAGGMGEVYRARDTRLDRTVAIKILPTADPVRRQRFEREARAVAALNHPHICTLHDVGHHDGTDFLVMEYLEGQTLAQRLKKGALPLDQALQYAIQIAEALDAAHRRGIVHRDLKPSNIMLTKGGAKLLDFGIATIRQNKISNDGTTAPRTERTLTAEGTIVGTLHYMAPEQLEGREADARSDLFAFGAVLYEMLTGRRAFEGGTESRVIAAVLDCEPPPISASQPLTPPVLEHVVKRCLAKDPDERWQTAADLKSELQWVSENVAGVSVRTPARSTHERLLWVIALLVAVAAGGGGTAWFLGRTQTSGDELRLEITTQPTTDSASLAVSPDGQQLVFVATSEGKSQLWVRSLDAVSVRLLAGTHNASRPFWSPDSQSIAFFSNGQLKRFDLDRGSVQVLGTAAAMGGAWNQDGTILFFGGEGDGLQRVSADGGPRTTVMPGSLRGHVLQSPQFLPDGRHFLFHAAGTDPGIYIGQLGASEAPRRILDAQAGTYASSGHLLFVRQYTLFAQIFDPVRLELSGNPILVAERIVVTSETGGVAALSASAAGPIVYRTGPSTVQSQFVWFDRAGKALETVVGSDVGGGFNSSLSPDGRRLAISRNVRGTPADIWLLDLNRGVPTRFTFDEAFDLTPVWSPDGRRIAFSSNRGKGGFDLYVKPASGAEAEELLEAGEAGAPSDWSPDGRFILHARRQRGAGNDDIWALALDGDRKAFPVVETTFNEGNGQFSPDGKWIAYQSNESGQMEIYVQPFPGPAQKTRISSKGGVQVRWRQDGRELFYLESDNRLMAVPIRIDSKSVEDVGTPVPLFAMHVRGTSQAITARNYTVARDGQRFLVDTLKEATLPITVILNWKAKP